MPQIQNLSEVSQKDEIIAEDLNVFGNVYEESIVDTHKLFVKGIVYANSTQFTKYAEIHEHRGVLRCHKAHIEILNGGEIHASSVTIDKCVNGSIYAQNIKIKNVESGVHLYASHSITIESLNGTNNNFHIDYRRVPIIVSKLELIQEDIQELNFLLQKAKENHSTTQKDIENEIDRLQKEFESIENSCKIAKISIDEISNIGNIISFTIDDDNTINYKTTNSIYDSFYLEFNDNQVTLHPTQKTITL